MDIQDALNKMFLLLEMHNVYVTPQCVKDINSLVKTDIKQFVRDFSKNFMRTNLKDAKKFERLKLTTNQNRRMDGNALFRYEYRNTSNLRCIYMVKSGDNNNATFLLNAFNEDKNKSGGKNSYNFNIERSIKTYQNIKRNWEG